VIAHVGDDAELYALGLLEHERRAEVAAHAASCDACLRRLGEAEETAAALAGALPRREPTPALAARFVRARSVPPAASRPRRLTALAVAAAFALIIGASVYQAAVDRGRLRASDLAVATLVNSHFLHVPMQTTPAGGSLSAKVLYARDGSWIYVLVDRASGTLDVATRSGGTTTARGSTEPGGETATLLVREAGKPDEVDLSRSGSIVARAKLVY